MTQNFHNHTSLALDTLTPKISIQAFHGFKLELLGNEDVERFGHAFGAQRIISFAGTVSTGGNNFDKAGHRIVFVDLGHKPVFGVITTEKNVNVGEDVSI